MERKTELWSKIPLHPQCGVVSMIWKQVNLFSAVVMELRKANCQKSAMSAEMAIHGTRVPRKKFWRGIPNGEKD